MEPVLIAAPAEKGYVSLSKALTGFLGKLSCVWAPSGAQARRCIAENDWGLVIVSAPLPDEAGADLAQYACAQTGAGVLLLVKEDIAETLPGAVADAGVLVLTKPLERTGFLGAARLALATHHRIDALERENRKLRTRLDDLRLISRAKCVLIECCVMTEPEAHAYIEKRAMDTRQTRRDVARELLESTPP